ncbi:unnamed protein product [Protopolystoma xenopodis]|uniref:Uncharacterized protein n=1 Tax=Protopolystoma xenopodis TaxID=117903 RepID=A0A3S4ZX61_9PLAT|nr:unnamed protein product [Protopolystoma xenopodis]
MIYSSAQFLARLPFCSASRPAGQLSIHSDLHLSSLLLRCLPVHRFTYSASHSAMRLTRNFCQPASICLFGFHAKRRVRLGA